MKQKIQKYIEENGQIIIISFFILILAYSIKLFTYSFSIDTEIYIMNKPEMLHSWISINRFSLVALKNMTSWIPFNIHLTNWMTILFFFISNLLTYHNFVKQEPKLKEKKQAVTFISILATSPIFLEQFNFTLQSAEIAFFLIIFQIAISFFIKYIEKYQIKYAILTIIMLMVCIGSYQSFVTMFITETMIILWFDLEQESKEKNKNRKKYIISSIIILLSSLILYYIIGKITINFLHVETSGYLKSQIGWINSNIKTSLINIIKSGVRSYFGFLFHLPQFTILNSFLLILTLIEFGKKLKQKKYFQTLLLVGIMTSPIIMSIALGNPEPIRACFNLPFVISSLAIMNWKEKQWYILAIWLFIFVQIGTMNCLEYSDYQRYKNDVAMAQEIYEKVKENVQDHALVFIGSKDSNNNQKIIKGEVMGYSFFDHYGLSDRAVTFMESIGLNVYGDLNYVEEAKQIGKDLPCYPDEKSILITEKHIIVKLS